MRTGAAVAVSAWLTAHTIDVASADPESPSPIHLRLRSTVCPSETAFWDAIARRTGRLRPARAGEAADTVDVTIVPEGRRIVGRMQIVSEGEVASVAPVARVVTGDSCGDVVATMSFMTALVFDPEAAAQPSSPPTPSATPPPDEALSSTRNGPPAGSAHWAPAVGAYAMTSTLGDLAVGAGAFVDLERASKVPSVGWLPSMRLAATVGRLDVAPGGVHGGVTWRLLEVDGCPWRAVVAERWALRPCLSVEGGYLDVSAQAVQNGRVAGQPWIAPGARVRVMYQAWDWLVLGADLALVFPVIRDSFEVEPSLRIYRAPSEAASIGASLGVRFL